MSSVDPKQSQTVSRFVSLGSSELVLDIVEKIDDLIARGMLVPGQRLIEKDLMQELGAGRMAVREAIRILACDGVVELAAYRSARIRKFDLRRMIEMLEALTGLFGVAIASFTKLKPDKRVKDAMLAARNKVRAAAVDGVPLEVMTSMLDYNLTLAQFAGNAYLCELIRRIHIHHYARQLAMTYTQAEILTTAKSFDRLTSQLLAGNLEGARATVAHSLELVIASIERRPLRV